MTCDVCLESSCSDPKRCAEERRLSIMVYGEIPVGTTVEITFAAGGGSIAPMYSVTIGATTYEVKSRPTVPPILLGRWQPEDPNGPLRLKVGRFLRIG